MDNQDAWRKEEGLVLVRRFTDELVGETTLERATKSAQRDQEFAQKETHRRRVQALYQDEDGDKLDPGSYDMKAAVSALQKAHRLLDTDEKSSQSKLSFLQRKSGRSTADQAVKNSFAQDFRGLQKVVESHEAQWRSGQNKIGRRFRKVCQKLDEQKGAFALFPSQDMYTSTLCGSLALIVNATVNYSEIAEGLSEMVASITDKATRAAQWLLLYKTKDLRELFAELYAQIFLFYRDAIEWYAKPKFARAFESFNAHLVKPYEKAVAKIESLLVEIGRAANVADAARAIAFYDDFEEVLHNQRRRNTDRDDLKFAGHHARRLLLLMGETLNHQKDALPTEENLRLKLTEDDARRQTGMGGPLSRAEAKECSSQLQKYVVGSEGPSLFKDGKFWLPEPRIVSMLGEWIGPDTSLSTLWVESPSTSRGFPGSRAAALTTVATAWDSEMPVISHFCARPYHGDLADDRTVEEVGLIGLVCSLIVQLVQFNVEGDEFRTTRERLAKLDGSDASWPEALAFFRELLRATPQVTRCVIDGLNELSFADGAEWCGAFLETLLEHQRSSPQGFKILLTTTGQSRVLPEHVREENTAAASGAAREVIRDGKWIDLVER